jgi:predicted TIM-barrel fold metal-dependent hydrolase
VALARGYNRWLANIWEQGEGRLRWAVIVPTSRMDIALEEINFGAEHGACGLFMRGIEGDYRPSDPYLYPLWEEAQRLNMPVCFHAATGNFDFFDYFARDAGFSTFKLPAVGAFHDIVMKQMHKKFPDLRWAFVEVSASWVPYAMNDISLRYAKQGIPWAGRELLDERNIFVAVQTADDIDYIVETAGEDNLVIGTDYGHNDTSTELRALTNLRDNGGLDPVLADKILDKNPRQLYAI